MMVFVSHPFGCKEENLEKAKSLVRDLQMHNTEDCFICPIISFSHLDRNEIGREKMMELCLDLLSCCDKLLVFGGEITEGVAKEIAFANLVNMEVEFAEH